METALKHPATQWVIRIACLLPAISISLDVLVFSMPVDPASQLNHRFGEWTLILLTLNLSIGILWTFRDSLQGPLQNVMRLLLKQRRWLGVTSFLYLSVHIFFYFVNEAFEKKALEQLLSKTYLQYGFLAALIFLAMALTSNNWAVRKLGGKNWKNLHRAIYVALTFIMGHVLLIEKADLGKFGTWFAVLWIAETIRFYFFMRRERAKAST